MPTVKYKPSADCAYTQLISKIKGVPILTEADVQRVNTPSPGPQTSTVTTAVAQPAQSTTTAKSAAPKHDVEVKKISSGLMLAQYYNSDSESDEADGDGEHSNSNPMSLRTAKSDRRSDDAIDDKPIPPGIPCPPEDQRVIIDKTAAYVLKNGKDFEEILRTKNDQRFTFLQYTDPFHKYYIFKVTGAVCADAGNVKPAAEPNDSLAATGVSRKGRIDRKKVEDRTLKPISESSYHQ